MRKPLIAIREAVSADAPVVRAMAEAAYKAAGHEDNLGKCDEARLSEIVEKLVELDDHDILVASKDGKAVGMIALGIIPVLLAPTFRVAREIAWWVDPDYRQNGVGAVLLEAALSWCVDHKAEALWMVSERTTPEIAKMCVNRGFRLLESIYVKRV